MHRLRVQYTFNEGGEDMDPCNITSEFSETEDYMVNVMAPICQSPTDLAVDVSNTTIEVSWTENGEATEWEVVYGEVGFDPEDGTPITVENDPNTTIDGLDPNTTYDVYVRAICGTDNESDFAGPEQFTTEMMPCPVPTDIVVDTNNITENSADVSWTSGGNETQWEIIYGLSGFDLDGDEGTSVEVNGTPETTLTSLDPDTEYDVYVVAVCDSDNDNSSDPAGPETFTTKELSVKNQVFENFTFYPNPVQDQLTLKAGTQIEKVEVYNLLGQIVMNSTPNQLQTQLNTERLQSGVYLMKVTLNGSAKTFRFIKR